MLCPYDYSCNTQKYIKSLDRYGKEVFFGVQYVFLAHISREIVPFRCMRGKTSPDLPTLSLMISLFLNKIPVHTTAFQYQIYNSPMIRTRITIKQRLITILIHRAISAWSYRTLPQPVRTKPPRCMWLCLVEYIFALRIITCRYSQTFSSHGPL